MARQSNRHGNSRLVLKLVMSCLMLAAVGWMWFAWDTDEPAPSTTVTKTTAPVVAPKTDKTSSDLENESASKLVQSKSSNQHPLDPVLQLARDAKSKMDREVTDYTATLIKRERINGKLGDESTMTAKIRHSKRNDDGSVAPLHVYLHFDAPAKMKGREVIWVKNHNENKLVAHEAGFLNVMRVNLDPTGSLAMIGNKYPITEIGIGRLIAKLIEKGERDRELGDCEVLVQDGHRVGDRDCQLIQVTHPDKKPEFDFHVAQIFFDIERMIPLRYAAYMWPEDGGDPPIEEEYTYLDVKLNVGLTDEDFSPDNKAYKFP